MPAPSTPQSLSAALLPPFVAPRNRDAWSTIRGFVYQADLTVERWLRLDEQQELQLECGEDIDIVTHYIQVGEERLLEQVKHREDNVTLKSASALAALANAVEHRLANPTLSLLFRYTTNAAVGRERLSTLPEGVKGIEIWELLRVSTNPIAEAPQLVDGIRTLFAGAVRPEDDVSQKIWDRFKAFWTSSSNEELFDFIRIFEWSTRATAATEMSDVVQKLLIEEGHATEAVAAYNQYQKLFLAVMKTLSQPTGKRLTRIDLLKTLHLPLTENERRFFERFLTEMSLLDHKLTLVVAQLSRQEHKIDEIITQLGSLFDLARTQALISTGGILAGKEPVSTRFNIVPPTSRLFRNSLPEELTSFIGREASLEEVAVLLRTVHLLTLTGDAGCGKTRLAMKVASNAQKQYPDGVCLLELASLSAPSLVPLIVATALGVKEQRNQPISQTLVDHLKAKNILLIIDNCEHLINACADLIFILIRDCPSLKILATSRERFGIGGETTYRVSPMSIPTAAQIIGATVESLIDFESVRLFRERAQSVKPHFAITNKNAPALAQLCRRLDGIPLAIELAAARTRSLSVEEINDKLYERFRLLTGGDRNGLPHHQTLRALIDWSYDLLLTNEQILMTRLSIFAGGATLLAVERVCAFGGINALEAMDLLTSLTDKSLLHVEEEEGVSRYRMLETVRIYMREKLVEEEVVTVQTRHWGFFITLAEEAALNLEGTGQEQWLRCLEAEHDNIRVALDACAASIDTTSVGREAALSGLRLSGGLLRFWEMHGYLTEGRKHLNRALIGREIVLANIETENITAKKAVASALRAAGILASRQGDYTESRSLYEEALILYREVNDEPGIATTLNNLGLVAYNQGDYIAARSFYEESLLFHRKTGIKNRVAGTLGNLGNLAFDQSDYIAARSLHEESLQGFRESGDKRGIANALNSLGNIAQDQGDYAAARSPYESCLQGFRDLGDKRGIAMALTNLGNLDYYLGNYAAAQTKFEECLILYSSVDDKRGIAMTLTNLGNISYIKEDYPTADSLYKKSLSTFREINVKSGIADALHQLGSLSFDQGHLSIAQSYYRESLSLYWSTVDKRSIVYSLMGIASTCATNLDTIDRAVVLWAAAEALRTNIDVQLSPSDKVKLAKQVSQAQGKLGNAAKWEASWAEGCVLPWEQALLLALQISDAHE